MELLQALLESVIQGSSPGVTALLLAMVGVVGWISWKLNQEHKEERKELIEEFKKQLESDRKDGERST